MRLEEWSLVSTTADPYKAPEQIVMKLRGRVYGNPRFEDGEFIITSRLVSFEGERTCITKSGSRYELGEVDPEYEKHFPNALERMQIAAKTKNEEKENV